MSATVALHTLRGRRDSNQDSAVAHEFEDGRLLLAVADGMGGHEGGGEASRLAVDTLLETVGRGGSLVDAVQAANAAVCQEATSTPARYGMGTTLVALLSGADGYFIANVGDSRAYRIGDGRIRQLTVDHSFANEALGKGMSQEEVNASPWRNALTRAIGMDPTVEVDVFGPFATEEQHWICLCSDGLYRAVADERIMEVLSASRDLDGVPKHLAELAYSQGSSDNITVAVLSVGNGGMRIPAKESSADAGAGTETTGAPRTLAGDTLEYRAGAYDRAPGEPASWWGPLALWWRRLSNGQRVEVWGTVITILLAAAAAYLVLNVL